MGKAFIHYHSNSKSVIVQNKSFKALLVFIVWMLHLVGNVSSEVYYIRVSPNDTCCSEPCLTLHQFVSNYSIYSASDIRLILAPGNHTLEFEVIVENVDYFSIRSDSSSPTAVIVCNDCGRFEIRNATVAIVRNVDFIGCEGNKIVSVHQFSMEQSSFSCLGNADCTTFILNETTAFFQGIAFVSINYSSIIADNFTSEIETKTEFAALALEKSDVIIAQSLILQNSIDDGAIIHVRDESHLQISNTTFERNHAAIAIFCEGNSYKECTIGTLVLVDVTSTVEIGECVFRHNRGIVLQSLGDTFITHSLFTNNSLAYWYQNFNVSTTYIFGIRGTRETITNCKVRHCNFIGNSVVYLMSLHGNVTAITAHNEFISNRADYLISLNATEIAVSHNTFTNNTVSDSVYLSGNRIRMHHNEYTNNSASYSLVTLNGKSAKVSFNEFIRNEAEFAIVDVRYQRGNPKITNNKFMDNSALFNVYVSSNCMPGFSLSLGSSRCIKCPHNWYLNLIGILTTAFVAGIALVIFIFSLNMTVAVGTINGLLFYANIVAINADAYFMLFATPNFPAVFISWLNLDIGFDVCFFEGMDDSSKALIELAFPAYIIILVVIVIVVSEYSSKIAKKIGKSNPVAVLATMMLFSYTKFCDAIANSVFLLYLNPAYGSLDLDITKLGRELVVEKRNYSLLVQYCFSWVFSMQF